MSNAAPERHVEAADFNAKRSPPVGYIHTDLYDAVVAERDRMREALHNLTSASNSMVIGIGIHNQIAERRDEHLIKGPVVTVFANACHEAHAALEGSS